MSGFSGSRHVVKSSVVMILASSTRFFYISDESLILTKPPAGICWSRNQVFPITSCVSCSGIRSGLFIDCGIEVAQLSMTCPTH